MVFKRTMLFSSSCMWEIFFSSVTVFQFARSTPTRIIREPMGFFRSWATVCAKASSSSSKALFSNRARIELITWSSVERFDDEVVGAEVLACRMRSAGSAEAKQE